MRYDMNNSRLRNEEQKLLRKCEQEITNVFLSHFSEVPRHSIEEQHLNHLSVYFTGILALTAYATDDRELTLKQQKQLEKRPFKILCQWLIKVECNHLRANAN